MVNRYLEATPLETFFGAQVCISGIQNPSWYKRGEQGERRESFLPKKEGRAGGNRGGAGRSSSSASRPLRQKGRPLPRGAPGVPGILCRGVLVHGYESITQGHFHPAMQPGSRVTGKCMEKERFNFIFVTVCPCFPRGTETKTSHRSFWEENGLSYS